MISFKTLLFSVSIAIMTPNANGDNEKNMLFAQTVYIRNFRNQVGQFPKTRYYDETPEWNLASTQNSGNNFHIC